MRINIRQGPSTQAKILTKVTEGTRLQIRGGPQADGRNTWWQVTGFDTSGTVGWIAQDFLKPVP